MKTKRYKTSKKVYIAALEACNGMCVLCGATRGLELHHILSRGRYLTDCLANCVFLCHNCHHNVVHQNLKVYRPILKEISKEIYGVELHEGKEFYLGEEYGSEENV